MPRRYADAVAESLAGVHDDVADAAMRFLYHDCAPDVACWGLTTRTSWYPDGLYAETGPLEAWPEVPSSYIVCSEDRTFRPDRCREAARTLLGLEPISIPGGHRPHVAQPKHLADVLSTLASVDAT